MSVVHSKFSVIIALVPLDMSLFIWHLPCDLSSMRHPACDDCTIASKLSGSFVFGSPLTTIKLRHLLGNIKN